MAFWALSDLQARLSAETVKQILDDDNDGTADTEPLARLRADSDSYVLGALRGIYDLTVIQASPPNEVKRLSLDAGVMYCAQRHPEYVRRDWEKLKRALDQDLDALRLGKRRLDVVGSPEPAANEGGSVVVPEIDDEEVSRMWDFSETGDF